MITKTMSLYFEVLCVPECCFVVNFSVIRTLNFELSPHKVTMYFKGGYFASKQSVGGGGGGGGLLRSDLPTGHFTSGGKLLCDRPLFSGYYSSTHIFIKPGI